MPNWHYFHNSNKEDFIHRAEGRKNFLRNYFLKKNFITKSIFGAKTLKVKLLKKRNESKKLYVEKAQFEINFFQVQSTIKIQWKPINVIRLKLVDNKSKSTRYCIEKNTY